MRKLKNRRATGSFDISCVLKTQLFWKTGVFLWAKEGLEGKHNIKEIGYISSLLF
jgi:hypothetical protein